MNFRRYIGIDYSGAETPEASLKGLRIYLAEGETPATEVQPPSSPRKYWSRREVAEWLFLRFVEDIPTLAGIDHGFSFPLEYFNKYGLSEDWTAFLDDFHAHWPTDAPYTYVDFVRDNICGAATARYGDARWKRLTEIRTRAAKSVFHFDVPGSVAKSTHAGLPWLRFLRTHLAEQVHFWPFDGWTVPRGKSVLAEVYPSLWNRNLPREGRTPDQHDAYVCAEWMRQMDRSGELSKFFEPDLTSQQRAVASTEGWILGVL